MVICPEILDFITSHKAVEILMVTAGIKTMPNQWSENWYETIYYWIYDGAHQFFNITNTRLTTQSIPTPPLNKDIILAPNEKGV